MHKNLLPSRCDLFLVADRSGSYAQPNCRILLRPRLLTAEDAARRAFRAYPEHPSISRPYLWLAAALGQQGRADEARSALNAAVAASPSYLKYKTGSRALYMRLDDHEHLSAAFGGQVGKTEWLFALLPFSSSKRPNLFDRPTCDGSLLRRDLPNSSLTRERSTWRGMQSGACKR